MDDLIEVNVREAAPDFASGQYKVILQDKQTSRILAIWVGHFEGSSISLALEEAWTPRPMTHDLIVNMLNDLQARVDRVVITDLQENTFYAIVCMKIADRELVVDSRPSDAIAIAVRLKIPIFISRALADKMTDELDEIFDRLEPKETVH
ncbi:bifunctional nuclease family protein [Thermodesulfobacteriota bacterium]